MTTITVELTRQPVELFKILKFEGLTDSGGAAKTAISEGRVRVNGVVETQKRKQIVSGDLIEFEGKQLLVHFAAPA
jgi:ribosome-associated protein